MEPQTTKELTAKEISLIRNSWTVVMKNPEENGIALFKTFLYKYEYFSLFPKFQGIPRDKLPKENVFRKHSLAIMNALDKVISNLENEAKLKESLNDIVQRHKNRNVSEHQFEELKGVILDCLAKIFKLPQESIAAWTKALGITFSNISKNIKS